MAKTVELGYSGIAYNYTIKGAMSQSDGCTIPQFPLSSLLKLHDSLSTSASFHRRRLGVPENVVFRQYTRLTVVVDSDAQSSALNSGNPVLKTYDLVAVRPLNQSLFDHACMSAQVDMISIDFGKKLPFRLKLSSVKAAIERGVYFEIMYSSFLEDAQARRQMISTAKLLVEWTRGKNLIVSSAAPSYHEIRGPQDVSNLLHLLGLSNERVKAAISKNCRLLIANALRKKQFYKEAIRVEMMPAGAPTNPKDPWIVDYLNWDPLSSGEGDLLLEDLAKSFAESGKVSQTVKSIDFTSLIDNVPSHVKRARVTGVRDESIFHSSGNEVDFVSRSMELEVSKETQNQQQEYTPFSTTSPSLMENADKILEEPACLSLTNSSKVDELRISPSCMLEDCNMSDTLEATLSPIRLNGSELQNCVVIQAEDTIVSEDSREMISGDACSNVECETISAGPENFGHNGVQAFTKQLGSGAFNKTESGVPRKQEICVHSNSLHSSDSYFGNHLLLQKPDSVAEAASTECGEEMAELESSIMNNDAVGLSSAVVQQLKLGEEIMNTDSSIVWNEIDGLELEKLLCEEKVNKELGKNEKRHSEFKTDPVESQLSNSMELDSFHQGKDVDNRMIVKSILHEEPIGETRDEVEEMAELESSIMNNDAIGSSSAVVQPLKLAEEIMNTDSSIMCKEIDSLKLEKLLCEEKVNKEHGQNEEHRSEFKTDPKESQLSNSMELDSFHQGEDVDISMIAKSILHEEPTMETRDEVQALVKAEHQSLGKRKSGNLKAKRTALRPNLMFPFKRLLQRQFTRQGRTSMYKTKKRLRNSQGEYSISAVDPSTPTSL